MRLPLHGVGRRALRLFRQRLVGIIALRRNSHDQRGLGTIRAYSVSLR